MKYMNARVVMNDGVEKVVENIVAIAAKPTTERTEIFVKEDTYKPCTILTLTNFSALHLFVGDVLYKTIE